MGTALYLYENLDHYCKKYENFVDPRKEINETSFKVLDLYIKDEERLWIILDTDKYSNRVNATRSITFFNLKEYKYYADGSEKLVTHDKIEYDPQSNLLKFIPKKFRKSCLELNVDKFNGEKPTKTVKIDQQNMFYDMTYNRLILIVGGKDEV